jgi:hypothetical protein
MTDRPAYIERAEIREIAASYLRPEVVESGTSAVWGALQRYRASSVDAHAELSTDAAALIRHKIVNQADELRELIDQHANSEDLSDQVEEHIRAEYRIEAFEFFARVDRELQALATVFDRATVVPAAVGRRRGSGRLSMMFAAVIAEIHDRYGLTRKRKDRDAFYTAIRTQFGVSSAKMSDARKEFPNLAELFPAT